MAFIFVPCITLRKVTVSLYTKMFLSVALRLQRRGGFSGLSNLVHDRHVLFRLFPLLQLFYLEKLFSFFFL